MACSSVLSALCKSGFPSEAIQFYIDKIDSRIKLDSYTYVGLLDSLCQSGRVYHTIYAYRDVTVSNPELNAYVHAGTLSDNVRQGWSFLALRTLREAIHANYALDVCYTIVLHGRFCAHLVERDLRAV